MFPLFPRGGIDRDLGPCGGCIIIFVVMLVWKKKTESYYYAREESHLRARSLVGPW